MGKLRQRMPIVDSFIDDLRLHFGREGIDRSIACGLKDGSFHARENGHEVGMPVQWDESMIVNVSQMVVD